jgi:hypothetical protein
VFLKGSLPAQKLFTRQPVGTARLLSGQFISGDGNHNRGLAMGGPSSDLGRGSRCKTSREFIPSAAPNTVDAAIARVTLTDRNDLAPSRLPYGGKIRGQAQPYDIDPATGGLAGTEYVYKVGRSSGYTEGYVSNVAAVVSIEFAGGTATFVNQIAVRTTTDNTGCFAEPGDSRYSGANGTNPSQSGLNQKILRRSALPAIGYKDRTFPGKGTRCTLESGLPPLFLSPSPAVIRGPSCNTRLRPSSSRSRSTSFTAR